MLRRLDLRGSGTDDLRRRLPRPAAQTEPPIDEVRALLAEVREHGDQAVRAFAERFDGVRLDDLRVPPAEVAAALEQIPADLREALEVAHDNIAAYHGAQRGDEVVHHNGAIEIRELVRPVDRVGCYVPNALAPLVSTALMTLVPAKVAGVPEVVLVSPARPDGKVPTGILAAAALAGADEVYRIGGPGSHRRAGLRHRVDPPGRRHRRSGHRRGWPRPSARSRAWGWWACRRRSPVPPRWWSWPTASTPAELAADRRHPPGRARPRRAGLAGHVGRGGGRRRHRGGGPPRRRVAPARAPRGDAWPRAATRSCCDDAAQALAVANAIAPEHLELLVDDAGGARAAGPPRRAPCSAARWRRRRSATTWPVPTTCCPPTARPGSRARSASTTSASTCTSSPSTTRASPRSAPHVVALAEYEGLPAHAESIRLRQGPV